jgi:hypothetical protein
MITSMPAKDFYNGFYNPSNQYGWANPNPAWQNQEGNVAWNLGEQQQSAPFTKKLAEAGFGGVDPKSQWGRSLYGRSQEGYGAAQLTNPGLSWQDYLGTLDFNKMYQEMTPSQKGFNDAQIRTPIRWQRRV